MSAGEQATTRKRRPLARSRARSEEQVDLYSKRAAITQCLHNTAPILGFYLSGEVENLSPELRRKFPDIGAAASWCMAVSRRIVREINGKDTPAAAELRPFRNALAKHLASCLKRGEAPNEQQLIKEMQQIAKVADTTFDSNPFREFEVDNQAMLSFIGVSAGLKLMEAVEIYSFRQDPAEVAIQLSQLLNETTKEMINSLLPEEIDSDNRNNVASACLSKLGDLMVTVYRQEVRLALRDLTMKSEAEKQKELSSRDFIAEIKENFRQKARVYSSVIENIQQQSWDDINPSVSQMEKGAAPF